MPSSSQTASSGSSIAAHGVGERAERPVGDIDELGRLTRGLARVGDDDGEDVAEIGGAAALGDEHGPVGVDDPDPQLTGDVGGGEHGLHARQRHVRPRCRCGRTSARAWSASRRAPCSMPGTRMSST